MPDEKKRELYAVYSEAGYKIKVYDYPMMQTAGKKRYLREFDIEELLFRKPIYQEDGIRVYYVNGVKQKNLGIVKIGEDFYYVCASGKLKQNGYVPVTEADVQKYSELKDTSMVVVADIRFGHLGSVSVRF